MRGGTPGEEAPRLAGASERAAEKAQLADAHAVMEDFRERAERPAAARKLPVERRMPGGDHRVRRVLELAAAPDAGKPRELVHRELHADRRAARLRITPTATPSISSGWRSRSRCRVRKSGFDAMSSALLRLARDWVRPSAFSFKIFPIVGSA